MTLAFSYTAMAMESVNEQIVKDAYIYILGRALVVRQEHIDLKEPGIGYNVIKYNALGSANFVNPNFDVVYLEAWIAVDEKTPVVLEIPPIKGRYYTAQICDEWGEVITNINERKFPLNPYGKFAFVAPGSRAKTPSDAVRIELHSHKAKMLARVELKTDAKGAVALQRQFKLKVLGEPKIEPAPALPDFRNDKLIGIELFDNAEKLLAGATDISPVAAQLQAKVRAVAEQAKDPLLRAQIDKMLHEQVIPEFLQHAMTVKGPDQAISRNNWTGTRGCGNFGSNYEVRSATDLLGIWANTDDEVIYFMSMKDGEGKTLNGSNSYLINFPAEQRPDKAVDGYWSVILVDVPNFRVVPNPINRFNFNSYSPLKSGADGSLNILIAPKPDASVPESNWLPAPEGRNFSLTFRTYVPKDIVRQGEWFPPAIHNKRPQQ
jgi:hypothetical protein